MSTSICTCCTSFVERVISAELGHFLLGELTDPGEDRAAQVAAQGHGRLRAEVDGDDRADDLRQGDQEHQPAGAEDVAGVTGGDALVDDVGVERGQVQRGDRLRELEHHHRRQQPPVWP